MPKGWRGSRQLLGKAEHLFYSKKKRQGERRVFSGCGGTTGQNRRCLDFQVVGFYLILEATAGLK